MDLLARLYDVTAGSILLDGKDVSAYSFETLCKKIGYIPQKATLFADTVEGNVSFGNSGQKKTKGDEEGGALDVAQATDFVRKLDGGLQSRIS